MALALTGMLLGLLSAGVYIVAEDWNRNSDRLDANLDDAVAILQIDRALQGAFPHSYTNEDTLSRQIYFTGEDDFVSWVSPVSPQRTPGLTSWELFNVDAEGVYLALAPAYSDNPSERLSLSVPSLILPGYSAQFSYLYEELDESKRWRNDWEAEDFLGLPLAVYVTFEPADRDREVLEIVARIRNNSHRSIRPNTGLQQGL